MHCIRLAVTIDFFQFPCDFVFKGLLSVRDRQLDRQRTGERGGDASTDGAECLMKTTRRLLLSTAAPHMAKEAITIILRFRKNKPPSFRQYFENNGNC